MRHFPDGLVSQTTSSHTAGCGKLNACGGKGQILFLRKRYGVKHNMSDSPRQDVRSTAEEDGVLILDEVVDNDAVGKYTGQVKWFSDRLGFGFATVCDGADKGRDIFVHHTGIRPVNSNYRTLRKGEYVNFNLSTGHNGPQAVDVTGIGGGSLMCDVNPTRPGRQFFKCRACGQCTTVLG